MVQKVSWLCLEHPYDAQGGFALRGGMSLAQVIFSSPRGIDKTFSMVCTPS